MDASLTSYLALGAFVFCIGLYGALTKRNAIVVLLCIELMLNAVNINLVAFNKFSVNSSPDLTGQIFSLFNIAVAAAEAAVAVAILIAWYRSRASSNVDEMNELKD
jgi:NADH-quinone oxidoreductase subunit K